MGLDFANERKVAVLREVRGCTWKEVAAGVHNLQGENPSVRLVQRVYQGFSRKLGRSRTGYKRCGRKPWKCSPAVERYVLGRLTALRRATVCTAATLQVELLKGRGEFPPTLCDRCHPRWPQNGAQDHTKEPQEGLKRAPRAPSLPDEGSKMLQEASKRPRRQKVRECLPVLLFRLFLILFRIVLLRLVVLPLPLLLLLSIAVLLSFLLVLPLLVLIMLLVPSSFHILIQATLLGMGIVSGWVGGIREASGTGEVGVAQQRTAEVMALAPARDSRKVVDSAGPSRWSGLLHANKVDAHAC